MKLRSAALAVACLLAQTPAPALAAPIAFDCDVPPDRFSTVSNKSDQPLSIKGIIEPVEFRSGQFLPVVGALLGDLEGRYTTTFQIVAPSKRAKQLDIRVNIKLGDDVRNGKLGTIGADQPMPFSMSLSEDGKVLLVISDQKFSYEFYPLSSGKEELFCSTGQFMFSEIEFGSDEPSPAG